MVGAIRGSTQKEPLVVGKPSTFMMDYLSNKYDNQAKSIHFKHFCFYNILNVRLEGRSLIFSFVIYNRFGISKSQICMVGDRLDTDILFGQNGGCKTLLVLSGLYI